MAILEKYEQQPNERLDRDIDFNTLFLSALNDTAPGPTGVEVTCERIGPAVDGQPDLVIDDFELIQGKVKVWLMGGTSGVTYKITARVTSAAGRVKEAEIAVKVKEV